jgi:acetolactate synthase-1/2/3 large subunit
MKLSDYIADFLVKEGVKHTFGITGGAIVHVLDSIYQNPNIEHICTHHEQGAAMAAEAYARITGNVGIGISTSGPGATNLLTGVCCAYYDSIPTVFITGQVPTSQLKRNSKVRQIGFQETDVVSIFRPVTKYCALIDDPTRIRYELEKAFYITRNGRPGPVLLDICDDVQRADINPNNLECFILDKSDMAPKDKLRLEQQVEKSIELIKESKRPVMILGGGIKLAKAEIQAYQLVDKLQFPVALTWATMDMFPDNHPLLIRDFGVSANRAGNFAVQNSDLILAIGTRLDTHEIGSKASTFAREAKKIVVDIDESELMKYEQGGMKADVLVNSNLRYFLDEILSKNIKKKNISNWIEKIKKWRSKYPICPQKYYEQRDSINPYVFMDVLSKESKEGDIIITDAGGNLTWTMQGFKVKKGQKLFSAFNHSPMGYSLPASIGASIASEKPVTCIIGDGGIQMNIQELATIAKYNLPIKIFLFNNQGYGIIRQTQDTWLNSRHYASSFEFGLGFPDFKKIAKSYGIKAETIKNHKELIEKLRGILDTNGPVLCDVNIKHDSKITPKLEFGKPIEDSSPLLDRREFYENMMVKTLDG